MKMVCYTTFLDEALDGAWISQDIEIEGPLSAEDEKIAAYKAGKKIAHLIRTLSVSLE
jgi:hypothetical protein